MRGWVYVIFLTKVIKKLLGLFFKLWNGRMPDFFPKNLATEAEPDISKTPAQAESYGVR